MICITPNWPAPPNIVGLTTLRAFGNLAAHVDDDPAVVALNRQKLLLDFALPLEPYWLNQIHSDKVVVLDESTPKGIPDADGSYTQLPGKVCAVLTADCLPILLCDKNGQEISALHAGWKGILANIIESGVNCFKAPRENIMAWFGPAIGPESFEVGPEVYAAFVEAHAENQQAFVASSKPSHFYLDIYQLARLYLNRLGITQIYGGGFCTFKDRERFYSYRRDGQTGRMVTLIFNSL